MGDGLRRQQRARARTVYVGAKAHPTCTIQKSISRSSDNSIAHANARCATAPA